MQEYIRLPPSGIHPIDDYAEGLASCRTEDKKAIIVYVSMYMPEDDPDYEDPDGSAFAWQNQQMPMENLAWMKKTYSIIHGSEPSTHPRIQRLVEVQEGTGFPVLELIPKGNLYQFLRCSTPRVPSGQGSENESTIHLRWALNIASALVFLHSKGLVYDCLGPSTVGVRDDISAVLISLDGASYEYTTGFSYPDDGFCAPDRPRAHFVLEPDTWVKPSQDIFSFGSFLYFLIKGESPPRVVPLDPVYPSAEGLLGSAIIEKCWKGEYKSMSEVFVAIKELIASQGLTVVGDDVAVDRSVTELSGYSTWDDLVLFQQRRAAALAP